MTRKSVDNKMKHLMEDTTETTVDSYAAYMDGDPDVFVRRFRSEQDSVIVRVTKPSKKTKPGLELGRDEEGQPVVTDIAPGGLFDETDLRVGVRILRVNSRDVGRHTATRTILSKIQKAPEKVVLEVLESDVSAQVEPKTRRSKGKKNHRGGARSRKSTSARPSEMCITTSGFSLGECLLAAFSFC